VQRTETWLTRGAWSTPARLATQRRRYSNVICQVSSPMAPVDAHRLNIYPFDFPRNPYICSEVLPYLHSHQ
jgi:hypothetical protein